MRLSQAGKLSCLLQKGASEADDSGSSRGLNVCRREQGEQVECGDVQDFMLAA